MPNSLREGPIALTSTCCSPVPAITNPTTRASEPDPASASDETLTNWEPVSDVSAS